MELIHDFETLKQSLSTDLVILLAKTETCSVCHAVFPRIESLAHRYGVPAYAIDTLTMPLARGAYQLFAAPIVLIFYHGKEMARQGPFVDFAALERVLQGIQALDDRAEDNHPRP